MLTTHLEEARHWPWSLSIVVPCLFSIFNEWSKEK